MARTLGLEGLQQIRDRTDLAYGPKMKRYRALLIATKRLLREDRDYLEGVRTRIESHGVVSYSDARSMIELEHAAAIQEGYNAFKLAIILGPNIETASDAGLLRLLKFLTITSEILEHLVLDIGISSLRGVRPNVGSALIRVLNVMQIDAEELTKETLARLRDKTGIGITGPMIIE